MFKRKAIIILPIIVLILAGCARRDLVDQRIMGDYLVTCDVETGVEYFASVSRPIIHVRYNLDGTLKECREDYEYPN